MKPVIRPLTKHERTEWLRHVRQVSDRSLRTAQRELARLLVDVCAERARRPS